MQAAADTQPLSMVSVLKLDVEKVGRRRNVDYKRNTSTPYGAGGHRFHCLSHAKRSLYHLSYDPNVTIVFFAYNIYSSTIATSVSSHDRRIVQTIELCKRATEEVGEENGRHHCQLLLPWQLRCIRGCSWL